MVIYSYDTMNNRVSKLGLQNKSQFPAPIISTCYTNDHYSDLGVYCCLFTVYKITTYLFLPKQYIVLFCTFLHFIKTVSIYMCFTIWHFWSI